MPRRVPGRGLFGFRRASITAREHICGRSARNQKYAEFEANSSDNACRVGRLGYPIRVSGRLSGLWHVLGVSSSLAGGSCEHGNVFTVAFTTCSTVNGHSVDRSIYSDSLREPRNRLIQTVDDKFTANFEVAQNFFMANRQFSTWVGNFEANKLAQSSNDGFNGHNEASQCEEIDSRSEVFSKHQTFHFQHQSNGSDFFEEVKITLDAGEPLMPRSLLDLAVEDFMHTENEQGHLLWQRLKKAAMGGGSFCMSVLATWLGEGNIASRPALIYSVLAFRSWKKNKRALELFDWVWTEKPFGLIDMDHAIYVDLVSKTEGCKKASKYLSQAPKTSMVYSALLAAYLEHAMEDNAKRMLCRARSFCATEQAFLFNQVLHFYKSKGRIVDVASLLKEMEDLGVDGNLSTYNIILDLKARKGDVSGMRNLWKYIETQTDMEPDAASYALLAKGYLNAGLFDRAEKAVKQIETLQYPNKRVVYRWLLKLFAQLKRDDHLERVWGMLKNVSKSLVDDYSIMVESLGKAGEVNRAEEVFKEGLSKFGIKRLHQYHTLISVFLNHGMYQKAEALVKELTKHSFNPGSSTYHQLIELYSRSGDEKKAIETLRKAQDAGKVFSGHKPWYASYLTVLQMLGKKGDIEHAELIVKEMKDMGYSCNFKMYSALLKAYVKANIMPPAFLDRMRADGAIPNSYIRKELEKIMDNRRELYEVNGARRYLY